MNNKTLVALCLLASASLHAQAPRGQGGPGGPGGPPQPPRPTVVVLDTDKDGTISAVEIQAASKSLLILDKNGDGQLTADEFSARMPMNEPPSSDELLNRLMAFDKNGDGILTKDEVPERMQPLFDRGDTNKDGKLTAEEIKALSGAQPTPAGPRIRPNSTRQDPILRALDTDQDAVISAAEIAAAPTTLKTLDKNGDGQLTANEFNPPPATPASRVEHMLEEWDTNKDGKLSKAECPDRLQPQFESLDKNSDGFLTPDELTLYFANMPTPGARQEGPRP
ncbi:MAG: EF-Hand, Calmodulin [Acidobacteriaceae bacterium]|nr:EF-Hand, Calmodulin [Acidobacteriaceae bacterium]